VIKILGVVFSGAAKGCCVQLTTWTSISSNWAKPCNNASGEMPKRGSGAA
jgi:hypothetical protein